MLMQKGGVTHKLLSIGGVRRSRVISRDADERNAMARLQERWRKASDSGERETRGA